VQEQCINYAVLHTASFMFPLTASNVATVSLPGGTITTSSSSNRIVYPAKWTARQDDSMQKKTSYTH
jgi:hypothetical protein